MTKRINLISGPRNISTALMYSFANRDDTKVVDEPFYAYYLQQTGVVHPGREEVLAVLPTKLSEVLSQHIFNVINSRIYFIKGMAHHFHTVDDPDFLTRLDNVFLIRDPQKIIASFSKVIKRPTLQDIGIKHEYELYQYLTTQGQKPTVLDTEKLVRAPRKVLSQLCSRLEIPFSEKMLQWSAGPKSYDGVWAKYWYHNAWSSTRFVQKEYSTFRLSPELSPLYSEAKKYYDLLKPLSLC